MDVNQALRILQISNDVTKDYLKNQYKKLCLEYHPDRNKAPGATQKFIEIKDAYEEVKKYLEERESPFNHPRSNPIMTHMDFNNSFFDITSTPSSTTFTFTINNR